MIPACDTMCHHEAIFLNILVFHIPSSNWFVMLCQDIHDCLKLTVHMERQGTYPTQLAFPCLPDFYDLFANLLHQVKAQHKHYGLVICLITVCL